MAKLLKHGYFRTIKYEKMKYGANISSWLQNHQFRFFFKFKDLLFLHSEYYDDKIFVPLLNFQQLSEVHEDMTWV